MRNIKAASRYAKALLDLSLENKKIDNVYSDILSLSKTIEGSTELQTLLKNPIVNSEKKQEVFKSLFGGSFNELSMNYINLLITKKREALLPEITTQFIAQFKLYKNIVTAEVTSAVKLTPELTKKVLTLVKHDGKVEILEKLDPTLIGGFIVKVGDKQIDASIAKKFKDLRKEIILN
jgi:F-type H+-transporting ATPase subunit delta